MSDAAIREGLLIDLMYQIEIGPLVRSGTPVEAARLLGWTLEQALETLSSLAKKGLVEAKEEVARRARSDGRAEVARLRAAVMAKEEVARRARSDGRAEVA